MSRKQTGSPTVLSDSLTTETIGKNPKREKQWSRWVRRDHLWARALNYQTV
jgi:hypothetical protein